MYLIFFIHFSFSGYLGCFQVLAMVNSAEMNTGVHVFVNYGFLRVYAGEENDSPLQCSCLENPLDRGVWKPVVNGVARVDMT